MSMESAARMSMMRMTRGQSDAQQSLARGTVRRTIAFAGRYRTRLIVFVAASIVGAVLGVASPVLAGDVVNAITGGADRGLVVRLALLIALGAIQRLVGTG